MCSRRKGTAGARVTKQREQGRETKEEAVIGKSNRKKRSHNGNEKNAKVASIGYHEGSNHRGRRLQGGGAGMDSFTSRGCKGWEKADRQTGPRRNRRAGSQRGGGGEIRSKARFGIGEISLSTRYGTLLL